jgi:hypothetical protein
MSITVIIIITLIAGVFSNPNVISRPVTKVYGYPVMIVVDISGSMGVGYTGNTSYYNAYNAFKDLIAERNDINFSLELFSS